MRRLLPVAVALSVAAAWYAVALRPSPVAPPSSRLSILPEDDLAGFARALAPRPFELPRDHGAHFEYQTEWWYYTGNLSSEAGAAFGYQLTFFRRGLSPGPPPEGPGLATNQVYFAHLALTDVARRSHGFAERWSRGAAGLAGVEADPYRVSLDDWSAQSLTADGSSVRLRARHGTIGLDLTLAARKPLVAHGNRGLSPKSGVAGNASYYVSYTRLATSGEVTTSEGAHGVSGESWFDHEWSTSALGPDAVGWDWWSLQLDDGRELMLFRVRRRDGTDESVSGGTLVDQRGGTRRLGPSDFTVETLTQWRSPQSGTRYPGSWRLSVPLEGLALRIEPLLAAQELRTAFTYWEGAVRVSGESAGRPVSGRGYVELTGYAAPMRGVF
jgi:predicted secreted hydrolase